MPPLKAIAASENSLRHLSRIDPHLAHSRDQCSPLKTQACCGAVRTADASLGLFQDSQNPVLFVDVASSGKSRGCDTVCQFGYRDRQCVAARQDHCTLHNILKLAYVPGPM